MTHSVSVLIPTYSRPQSLRRALASVVAGAPHDAEILVNDDGELGAPVVAEFSGSRVRYERNAKRLGIPGNWERLIARASGDAVLLLMDDDRVLPGFFEACLDPLRDDPRIGVAFTDHYFERGRKLERRICVLGGGQYADFSRLLMEHNPVPISAALIRRAALLEALPLPQTAAADLVIWARLASRGWHFHYSRRPLMVYSRDNGNYSADTTFRTDVIAALETITFEDHSAEQLRRRQLADALLSRGAAAVQRGDSYAAATDAARALELGPSSRTHARIISVAARRPTIGRILGRLSSLTKRRPWRTGWNISG